MQKPHDPLCAHPAYLFSAKGAHPTTVILSPSLRSRVNSGFAERRTSDYFRTHPQSENGQRFLRGLRTGSWTPLRQASAPLRRFDKPFGPELMAEGLKAPSVPGGCQ